MAYDAEGWLICKMLQQSDNRVAWSFPFGIHCLTDDSQPFPEQFVHGNGPVCDIGVVAWVSWMSWTSPTGKWTHEMWLMLIRYRRAPLLRDVFDLWPPPPPIHPLPSATWALLSNWFYLTWLHFNHPQHPPQNSAKLNWVHLHAGMNSMSRQLLVISP